MQKQIPRATVQVLARSIYKEASKYGFGQLDMIRLVNELMDLCTHTEHEAAPQTEEPGTSPPVQSDLSSLPVTNDRLKIRQFDSDSEELWMAGDDEAGALLARWRFEERPAPACVAVHSFDPQIDAADLAERVYLTSAEIGTGDR